MSTTTEEAIRSAAAEVASIETLADDMNERRSAGSALCAVVAVVLAATTLAVGRGYVRGPDWLPYANLGAMIVLVIGGVAHSMATAAQIRRLRSRTLSISASLRAIAVVEIGAGRIDVAETPS